MIEGVEFHEVISSIDHRGFFKELIKSSKLNSGETIGQISHSLVYNNVIKGWHAHKIQTQWNYIVNGVLYVVLCDLRKNSKTYKNIMTFLVGDNQKSQIYKFPPGVYHGYKCLSAPMNIIYFTSGEYDLDDELRLDISDSEIDFNWANLTKIK
jgi:dTDP-4-dehydrorhamnose 3,5-epimerase